MTLKIWCSVVCTVSLLVAAAMMSRGPKMNHGFRVNVSETDHKPDLVPVATYDLSDVEPEEVDGATFYAFKGKTCKFLFEHTTEVVPIVPNVTKILEKCAAGVRCQSVYCNTDQCTLLSPTCMLDIGSEGDVTYVVPERIPKQVLLKERVLGWLANEGVDVIPPEDRPPVEEFFEETSMYSRTPLSPPPTQPTPTPPWIPVTERDLRAFSNFVLIDPIHLIVFFLIPKVACSEYLRLYDRLVGHADYNDALYGVAVHFRFHDPTRERLLLKDFTPEDASKILNSPSYRKVVMFREPKERLLSAYLDKFVINHSYHVKVFHNQSKMSFADLVEKVAGEEVPPGGVGPKVNAHWRSQPLISNIYKFLPVMSHIGWGNGEHTKQILTDLDLWETYGATGWESPLGFMQTNVTTDGHATHSRQRLAAYYTPELEAAVDAAYGLDLKTFEILNLTLEGNPVDGSSFPARHSICPTIQGLRGTGCWPGELVPPHYTPEMEAEVVADSGSA